MIYLCRPCDARVGVHKNSKIHAPKGSLANRELRELRMHAHLLFDMLWKTENMPRKQAYIFLQDIMEMSKEEAHIGKFSAEQCHKLIDCLEKKR